MLIYDGVGDGGAMNVANEYAAGLGGAGGEDPSRLVKQTPLLAVLKSMKFETTRQVDIIELKVSAYEAMLAISRMWVGDQIDFREDLCKFYEKCVFQGFATKIFKSTICAGVLNDGKHIHVDVEYGYNTAKTFLEVHDVYLEDDE